MSDESNEIWFTKGELEEHCKSFGKGEGAKTESNDLFKEQFAAGKGVINLAPGMPDGQILHLIKLAGTWSQGAAFKVIYSPKMNREHDDQNDTRPV